MRSMRYIVVAALLLIVPSVALAQETRFEVTPHFGWRHGNDVSDVSGLSVDLDSGVAFGFMVDVRLTGGLYAEFIYSRRSTGGVVFVPPGIDPDDLDRIFQPFFTTKRQGSGVGLAVVKKIVGSHRGIIDVSSAPGEGAEIVIRLPMAGRLTKDRAQ